MGGIQRLALERFQGTLWIIKYPSPSFLVAMLTFLFIVADASKYRKRSPTFAAIFSTICEWHFQPLPLSRRALPFDHPEWISELKYDGSAHSPSSKMGDLLHPLHHPRLDGGVAVRGRLPLMTTFQSSQPILFEASAPARDRGRTGLHASLDLAIALAFARAKISRARNTSPAGKVRDCAHCSSSRCSSAVSLNKFRLSVMSHRRSKRAFVITGTLLLVLRFLNNIAIEMVRSLLTLARSAASLYFHLNTTGLFIHFFRYSSMRAFNSAFRTDSYPP